MNWRIDHLNLFLKNEKISDMDTTTEQRLECTEETSKQYLDIGGHSGVEKWTHRQEEATWVREDFRTRSFHHWMLSYIITLYYYIDQMSDM